jgi:hypothetical protein
MKGTIDGKGHGLSCQRTTPLHRLARIRGRALADAVKQALMIGTQHAHSTFLDYETNIDILRMYFEKRCPP